MGSPSSEHGRNSNEKEARVRISKGFWLSKTEITREQWRAVVGGIGPLLSPNTPQTDISWQDCQIFISKLIKPPQGWRFDLPTEAQWEYACLAGDKGPFAGELDELAWHFNNSRGVQPVALKKPNKWGLHDMHGNVFEWCRDAYLERVPGGTDPHPKNDSQDARRVRKGGSWYYKETACRAAYRLDAYPDFKTETLGFRLALVPESL
jgi:formylglycine-generating enzyme required for sulfatase activity